MTNPLDLLAEELTDDDLLDTFRWAYAERARDPAMDAIFNADYDAAVMACDLAGVIAVAELVRRVFAEEASR